MGFTAFTSRDDSDSSSKLAEIRRWSKLRWQEISDASWCLKLEGNRAIRVKLNQFGSYEVWRHDKGISQHRATEPTLHMAIEAADEDGSPNPDGRCCLELGTAWRASMRVPVPPRRYPPAPAGA